MIHGTNQIFTCLKNLDLIGDHIYFIQGVGAVSTFNIAIYKYRDDEALSHLTI